MSGFLQRAYLDRMKVWFGHGGITTKSSNKAEGIVTDYLSFRLIFELNIAFLASQTLPSFHT